MSCNDNNGNLFIGGYCLLSKEEVSKKFFIGYFLGINNTIVLNVNEPLTFLIKDVSNFDLQIRNIKFN